MSVHLYFNGDSYTAGTELGDEILPNFPGLFFNNEIKTLPKHIRDWFKNVYPERQKRMSEVMKLEYERSFPNKIATKLNLPFTNSAMGGSSMDRITRTTITDLIELRKNNPQQKIIAFIGVTSFTRIEIPVPNIKDESQPKWMCEHEPTKLLGYEENLNYTDYHRLVYFYKNIITIKDFCKQNNITLYWINFWHHFLEGFDYKDRDFINLKEYADLTYIFNWEDYFRTTFQNKKIFFSGGHMCEIVHDFIADKLVEIIKSI